MTSGKGKPETLKKAGTGMSENLMQELRLQPRISNFKGMRIKYSNMRCLTSVSSVSACGIFSHSTPTSKIYPRHQNQPVYNIRIIGSEDFGHNIPLQCILCSSSEGTQT